ncbi:MAG: HRDC domain-containing protein [Bacillus sp. (in: Bacteria)]|nr:HRDC domain-containing protein [Bacillus sp. (in: firmicutes)]
MLDKYVEAIVNFIFENHNPKPLEVDKYLLEQVEDVNPQSPKASVVKELENIKTVKSANLEKAVSYNNRKEELVAELKLYRLNQSKKEDVKAYFIFNNSTLQNIVNVMPVTLHELQKIKGFGEVKAQKYGPSIIEIVNKYK